MTLRDIIDEYNRGCSNSQEACGFDMTKHRPEVCAECRNAFLRAVVAKVQPKSERPTVVYRAILDQCIEEKIDYKTSIRIAGDAVWRIK